jgi:hypothetical protein
MSFVIIFGGEVRLRNQCEIRQGTKWRLLADTGWISFLNAEILQGRRVSGGGGVVGLSTLRYWKIFWSMKHIYNIKELLRVWPYLSNLNVMEEY